MRRKPKYISAAVKAQRAKRKAAAKKIIPAELLVTRFGLSKEHLSPELCTEKEWRKGMASFGLAGRQQDQVFQIFRFNFGIVPTPCSAWERLLAFFDLRMWSPY